MADNYLENRMDAYQRGELCPRHVRVRTQPTRGTIYYADITGVDVARVKDMIRDGYDVCFSHPDVHAGARLARTLGCKFVPPGMEVPADAIII